MADDDYVMVPRAALDWLFGAGPDPDGKWFGECEDAIDKLGCRYKPKFWWRSKFRSLIPALAPPVTNGDRNPGEA